MSNKAILCYISMWSHELLQVYSCICDLVPGSSGVSAWLLIFLWDCKQFQLLQITEKNLYFKKDMPVKFLEPYRAREKKVYISHSQNTKQKKPNKERILKAVREESQVTYKGRTSFSVDNLKARSACTDVLQTLRDHRFQHRILYPTEISITVDGKNKTFHYKFTF